MILKEIENCRKFNEECNDEIENVELKEEAKNLDYIALDYHGLLDKVTLEYSDIDVKITVEASKPDEPYKEKTGHIYDWDYKITPEYDDLLDYLGLESTDLLTQELIDSVDKDDFINFLYERYYDEAVKDASENWTDDFVFWDEDFEPDYDEEDTELDEPEEK